MKDCSNAYLMRAGDAPSCVAAAKAFLKTCTRPVIFHISDTDTTMYPFAEALLAALRPELTVHTGDMADEYKAGRLPAHVPAYLDWVPKMLDSMEKYSAKVWWVQDNNDISSLADDRKTEIVPSLARRTFSGVKMELDHDPIPAAYGVDFALYGHGPTDDLRYPLENLPNDTAYLNGNYFFTLIDCATKRYIRLPSRPAASVMRLIIVSHGQTCSDEYSNNDYDPSKADPPITKVGIKQARFTAAEILRRRFSGKLISSPFTRAVQTIAPIAEALQSPVTIRYEFREICKRDEQVTGFRGKTLAELKREFPFLSEDTALPYPWWSLKAEMIDDVQARVSPLLEELLAAGENVLLMGHGASTDAAVQLMLEKCNLAFNSYMDKPAGGNCTISEFRITNGKIRPISVFSADHLPAYLMTANERYALNKPDESILN